MKEKGPCQIERVEVKCFCNNHFSSVGSGLFIRIFKMLGLFGTSTRSVVSNLFVSPDNNEEISENQEDEMEKKKKPRKGFLRRRSSEQSGEPDTSSFMAFLVSLLSCTDESARGAKDNGKKEKSDGIEMSENAKNLNDDSRTSGRKSKFTKSKNRSKNHSEECSDIDDKALSEINDIHASQHHTPEMSDDSLLLSKSLSSFLSSELPTLARGRKWVLLYSTWKHGISLLTLYRKSVVCPGPCLLVVGDGQGAVFGGLVSAPLRPTNSKKYQGTNDSFVFTNVSGAPALFRPTGVNRYFVLCSADSLALGGGGHFALYLDGDLLRGSSASSATFGNSCLAKSEDFELKQVELWGFVHASKSISSPTEGPGLSSWYSQGL